MAPRDTSMGGSDRLFPSTAWSMVAAAGDAADPRCREQLERLLELYWKPAYCYLRACGVASVEDAKDLTQDFFTRLLEKGGLGRLDPQRGTFRGFLMRALRNFKVDSARHERARRPQAGFLFRLEECRDLETRIRKDESAEVTFDREWSRTLLHSSVEELERRMRQAGLEDHFEIYRSYCLPEGDGLTYEKLAARMGITETDVRKRLERCRRELRAIVQDKIRDYVRDESDVEAEFREIVKG